MEADSAKLIWDALRAAEAARRMATGADFGRYRADEMLRSAIERQLEILGEALSQLRRVDPATASMLSDLPRAVALRNILIHAYADVDDAIVWGVVERHLEPLMAQLRPLLPTP
jgi:uncharacterized protein with HEPN domain